MTKPYPYIEALSVIGGFLDGLALTFLPGLNTIIGARGTGKTTVVAFLAYALDALPSRDHAADERKRLENLVKRNLEGGRISVTVRARDGLKYVITRSYGDEPIVLDAAHKPVSKSMKTVFFQADVYSQNAVERIADKPLFQLDLIDSFAGDSIAQSWVTERQLLVALKANALAILPLEHEIGTIQDELSGLANVQNRLTVFETSQQAECQEINEAHAQKGLRDRETRWMDQLREVQDRFQEGLRKTRGQLQATPPTDFDPSMGPNRDLLETIFQQRVTCAKEIESLLSEAIDRMAQVQQVMATTAVALAQRHREQELAFRATIERHKHAQEQAAERAELERRRNHLISRQHHQAELIHRLEQFREKRQELLDALSHERDERFGRRVRVTERMNQALAPTIRAQVIQSGNRDPFRQLLETRFKAQGLRAGGVAQKLAAYFQPSTLAQAIRSKAVQDLMDRAELNGDQAAKAIQALADAEFLFGLETIELGDQPVIELLDGPAYKDTSSLSTGQKCTTILPMLLLGNDNPLAIDQPEDNLDNRFIFQTVVENIERVKANRQLILVTHNPNIPVLGDANQVVVLESDGTQAQLRISGTLNTCKTDIVTLLEGGAEAFRRRGVCYGQ